MAEKREAGVDEPQRLGLPRPPPPTSRSPSQEPGSPGGASRAVVGRAARPPGLFVLPRAVRPGAARGPRRGGPGADVGRDEWQEISQGLPPPRAPANRLRGRCSRAGAHSLSRIHASRRLLAAALPVRVLRRACSGCGPGPWALGPGPLRAAPGSGRKRGTRPRGSVGETGLRIRGSPTLPAFLTDRGSELWRWIFGRKKQDFARVLQSLGGEFFRCHGAFSRKRL
ncbi:uncharacterized protein LOC144577256 isoform X3 [Callithrix jacchus]